MDARGEQDQIELERVRVTYRIRRSARRRTVTLAIDPERGLVIYCPRRYPRRGLETLLREKARWILDKIAWVERLRAQKARLRWVPGSPLLFQGTLYPLEVHRDGRGPLLRRQDERLTLHIPERAGQGAGQGPTAQCLREHVIAGYKAAARREIMLRVEHFQAMLGVRPRTVRIKAQRKRWGSCSALGGLNFNWRLILAPPPVLDYLVVHELCHLLHPDHSRGFWGRVAAMLPDYRARQAWLREHGAGLYLY